ncbi:PHF7 protein, partial [Dromaius novaehollandiae]|nr:PHF7 protein [Dromaius novaehollandiae]
EGRRLCSLQCCFACSERGVAISCQGKGCSRSFHLPCTSEHSCVTQFFKEFSSFCWEHRPEQAVQVHPDVETTCIICLEPVGDKISHNTMACPACKGTWFHRGCIRVGGPSLALWAQSVPSSSASLTLLESLLQGQVVPDSRSTPAWEEDTGCEELYQRHSWCDASQCLSRQGRQQAEERGPWELLLCSSCASKGTHRRCSALGTGSDSWECDECAGLGPGKRQ